jgi:hypothetical protein
MAGPDPGPEPAISRGTVLVKMAGLDVQPGHDGVMAVRRVNSSGAWYNLPQLHDPRLGDR